MTYASAGTEVTVRIASLNSWTVAAHSRTATRACTPSTSTARIPANSTRVPPVETTGQVKTLPPTGSPSGFTTSRMGRSYIRVAFASQSLKAGICAIEKITTISAYGE